MQSDTIHVADIPLPPKTHDPASVAWSDPKAERVAAVYVTYVRGHGYYMVVRICNLSQGMRYSALFPAPSRTLIATSRRFSANMLRRIADDLPIHPAYRALLGEVAS